jgi:xylulokinase
MAAIGVGLVPPETDWARTGQTITPDPETREIYDTLYRGYCELYPATKTLVHQLAQLQEQQAVVREGRSHEPTLPSYPEEPLP